MLNETHDPSLTSWVPATLSDAADFPVQNLPFGRFQLAGAQSASVGVAIHDAVLDLSGAARAGLISADLAHAVLRCEDGWLNALMALPPALLSQLRLELSRLLRSGSEAEDRLRPLLLPRPGVLMLKPVDVRNFSDFFTSVHHARNAGKLKRPDNPLFANFHTLPVAYHGRASTVCVSGTDFIRPHGQRLPDGAADPVYGPSIAVDYECEIGVYVGRGTALGERPALKDAADHVFGLCLLNDWSARDIQGWEAAPLGPFLAKSFLTSVSPWIVTLEALAPFRVNAAAREAGAPALLPHLDHADDRSHGGFAIDLEIGLTSAAMRQAGQAAITLSRPKFTDQYWTIFQMLTHQGSNGCRIETGDLIGTGTISGPREDELGCLLEATRGGRTTFALPSGETRSYLADGDEVTLSARCAAPGRVSIGFGLCTGRVLPS